MDLVMSSDMVFCVMRCIHVSSFHISRYPAQTAHNTVDIESQAKLDPQQHQHHHHHRTRHRKWQMRVVAERGMYIGAHDLTVEEVCNVAALMLLYPIEWYH